MKKVDPRKKGPSRVAPRDARGRLQGGKGLDVTHSPSELHEGVVHDQQEKPKVTASRRKDFAEALRRVIKAHDAVSRKLAKS